MTARAPRKENLELRGEAGARQVAEAQLATVLNAEGREIARHVLREGEVKPTAPEGGKVKVIANLNDRRYPAWPDVATLRESVPGYEPVPSWTGLWAPAGITPSGTGVQLSLLEAG